MKAPQPMKNFQLSKFLGKWCEQARTKNITQEKPDDLDISDTYLHKTETTIDVEYRFTRDGKENL